MKKFLLIATTICSLTVQTIAQVPNYAWAKRAGGTNNDAGYGIATDDSGNVFTTGYFLSASITFDTISLTSSGSNTVEDFFLAKYDASGNVLWAKSATDAGGVSVSTNANGNIFVTGYFYGSSITFGSYTLSSAGNGDFFIVKYDSNGNVLWAKRAGGTNFDMGYGISTDVGGNVFVTGLFKSASIIFDSLTLTNANAGYYDLFIVKYDPNGNVLWGKKAGYYWSDYGYSVTTDTSGNVFMSGTFNNDSITFDSITLTRMGGGNADVFVVKYDPNGNALWAKNAGGAEYEQWQGVSTDDSGNVFLTGCFYSSSITFDSITLNNINGQQFDLFLVKYSPNGNLHWAKRAGGTNSDFPRGISTDENGNVFLTGTFMSASITFGSSTLTNSNYSKFFIAKYDSNGNALWAKGAGGSTNYTWGYGITTDTSGDVFTTGYFQNATISFDSYTLTNASSGKMDIFVNKLNGTTGIVEHNSASQILIYPNPFSYQAHFQSDIFFENATFIIYNSFGQIANRITNISSQTLILQRNNLPNGIYFYQILDANKILNTGKFIIE